MARTILVVEDETTLRETLADALDAEGFRVVQAADGREALARFRGDRPDLVLLHIDPTRLRSEVRYENLEGGESLFPHVYGAIPIGAVLNVVPLRPLDDGSFGA